MLYSKSIAPRGNVFVQLLFKYTGGFEIASDLLNRESKSGSVLFEFFCCPYPASRVSFDLPRPVGKRKETLRGSSTFFDLPLIQRNG